MRRKSSEEVEAVNIDSFEQSCCAGTSKRGRNWRREWGQGSIYLKEVCLDVNGNNPVKREKMIMQEEREKLGKNEWLEGGMGSESREGVDLGEEPGLFFHRSQGGVGRVFWF